MTEERRFHPINQDLLKLVTRAIVTDFVRLSQHLEPYGLIDPTKARLDEPTLEPLLTFNETDPYGNLIRATSETLYAVGAHHLSRHALSPLVEEAYDRVCGISQGGIIQMGLILELIPIVHLKQFPNEDPSAEDLAKIAENSYYILAHIANQPEGVAIPMVNHYFNVKELSVRNLSSIISNWRVVDEIRPNRFNIEETENGRRLVPKDMNQVHTMAVQYAIKSNNFNEGDHCPALEVRTEDGDGAINAVWQVMLNAARKWHYIHTIPEMRKAQAV